MSEGPKSRFSILASTAAKAVTAVSAAFLAACATPITQAPQVDPDAAARAAQRQKDQIKVGRKAEAPDSPYINFPVDQRVGNVANRIYIAGAPFCGENVKTTYNISVGTPDGGQPVVMDTQAPLQPGDRVIAVNGQRITAGLGGRNSFYSQRNQSAGRRSDLAVEAMRGNQRISARLNPVSACSFGLQILPANTPQGKVFNAFADGNTVYISPIVPALARNDSDLGFVIGHELGHNAMHHMKDKLNNARVGAVLGAIADIGLAVATNGAYRGSTATQIGVMQGAGSYSVQYESEADYIGEYLIARAGYDTDAGIRVADRLALQGKKPELVDYATSHPATKDRAAAAAATEEEIRTKQATGKPLSPNLKSGGTLKMGGPQ